MWHINRVLGRLSAAALLMASSSAFAIDYTIDEHGNKTSRISDKSVPVLNEDIVPDRPDRLLELGGDFLGTGPIGQGIEMPGGAVWQPSLLVYGSVTTGIQTFKNPLGSSGNNTLSEWANRLDIFANLQLTGTERILLGMQPIHQRDEGTYTGINFRPDRHSLGSSGSVHAGNNDITTFFFEGDIGEMFPNLDPDDFKSLDLGIAVGRQPIFYQDGFLINDTIDAFGIIRNNLILSGGSNLQITGLYGWGEINRADNIEAQDELDLYGIFVQADIPWSTLNFDLVATNDRSGANNDGLHWGISAQQRIGHISTSFHLLGSETTGRKQPVVPGSATRAVDDGALLVGQFSTVLPWSDDNVYMNAFVGKDSFTSAARGPEVGGPLGRIGLTFASAGLGRYGAPINNQAEDSWGFAIGWQHFINNSFRRQFLVELGARESTDNNGPTQVALLARYLHAFGQHTQWEISGFYSYNDANRRGVDKDGYGLRTQLRYNY